MANGRKKLEAAPEKPGYLVRVEAEAAGLEEKHNALSAIFAAGKVTPEQYQRRCRSLLEQRATMEIIVSAATARWETFGTE